MPALFALGFVVLILGALWLHARSNVRLAQRHMAGRGPLSSREFGQRYFSAAQAPIATRLRELLAAETVVHLDRLHPDDRPVQDLRIDELDSLTLAEFVVAIEKEFKIELADADVARIRTFRDLVELVSRQLESAGTA
jgi:acyl carrier protein